MRKSLIVTVILCSFIPHESYALFGFGKVERAGVPIIEATELGNAEYVKTLINQGADINAVDKNGQTALMKAAASGNDQMVAILITNGADIQIQDGKGNSALHYAAANDHATTTQMLISNGAIVNMTNRKGQTPLELAINNGSVYAIRVIDPGALSVVETNAGFTIAAASAGAAGGGMSTTAVVTTATGVAAAGAGIAAAAGGGGGGSDESSSSSGGSAPDNGTGDDRDNQTPNPGNNTSLPPSQPSFNLQNEYNNQPGLGIIKAQSAYNKGVTGNEVKVAVVDTGVDRDNFELSGNISSLGVTYNNGVVVGNGDSEGFPILNISDINKVNSNRANFWHGTHVTGIIAASQNGSYPWGSGLPVSVHGVAYDADIIPVNVSINNTTDGELGRNEILSVDIAKGIDYSVTNDARVINISLGSADPTPLIKDSIQNAVNKTGANSVLVVAAAGNLYDGAIPGELGAGDDPISVGLSPVYPAYYASDSNINPGVPDLSDAITEGGALIAVGAVDNNGNMASFSNRCGDAKQWCLVAPGQSIRSLLPDGRFIAEASGTSMAAPHVSGAAALLIDQSPFLSGREVAEILLLTADPLGAEEISDEYGHGLLNVEKAINQPVGTTSIALGNHVNGSSVSLNSSSINVSPAFGDAVSGSDLSFMILDDYNRAFYVDVADVNYESNSFIAFEDRFRDFGQDVTLQREYISENVSFTAVNISDNDPSIEEHEKEEFVRMSFLANNEHGGFGFNHNVPMNQAFRMSALSDVSTSMDNVSTNSVLGLVSRGTSYSNHYVLDKNSSVSFGSFQGEQEYGDVSGVVSQYSRKQNMWEMTAQFGMMNEESSFLGSKTDGAFSIGENTPTWFYNFASAYNVSSKVKLFGSVNYGISFPQAGANSLINDISQIQTYSFSSGVSKKGVFDEHDKMEFIVSQPLRVIDGSANVVLPVARDFDGNIYTSASDLSLSPSGRQIDIGAFYTMPFSKKSNVSAGAVYMTQSGHNKNADDEMVFMSKFNLEF